MSVQFGRWNFDNRRVDQKYIHRVNALLAPYGPDGWGSCSTEGVSVLYHAFHTTKESRRETQPYISPSGAVIAWDGRLDNRSEFIHRFSNTLSIDSADALIVAAAYGQWGTDCFAKLVGDWALSLWSPSERSLILAKDPIGTHHLYYSLERDHVAWSTILDPLVLLAERTFALDEEYIAGWFSFFPAVQLTPCVGMHSVPASHFVEFKHGWQRIQKYWDFDPEKTIRYGRDQDYEEHFRAVLTEAVRRRLRSDRPVLAELSGGMDSSSIVCIADRIMQSEVAPTPRVDTLSYYDDSEPNWNERPFFTKIEERRGHTGCHIDLAVADHLRSDFAENCFPATPYSVDPASHASEQFAMCLATQGNRVVLSGVGRDEITGGVPTPVPELMNSVAAFRFKPLAQQLKLWALHKRKPWLSLLLEASRGFFPPAMVGVPQHLRPPEWLQPDFIKRQRFALSGYPTRVRLFGSLPSFQEGLSTLEVLRRQLANSPSLCRPPHEKSYPYLDRDLLEFVYAIPREQLVRPGQRRSLMRRALTGIVPDEILNRKRKAFVVRAPMAVIDRKWQELVEVSQHLVSDSLGIVDTKRFSETVQKAREGREIRILAAMRTLRIELWLRGLRRGQSWSSRFPELSIHF
ncbi:MAG: asparagine synthase-related protein [Candidatus Acidiferrales bacterium]